MNLNATLIVQAVVLLLLALFTMKFIWPPLIAAIEERQKKIADGLAAADRAQKELAAADEQVAAEVRKARVEAAGIIDKAHQQYNVILDKAKVDAVAESNRQKAAAEAEVQIMLNRARETLRGQVASLAIAGAEKIIQREVNAETHKSLLDKLVADLK